MTKRHYNEKWTYETVKAVASLCKNKVEFQERFGGAKKWAKRNGCYDDVCAHMQEQFRWTLELIKLEASKFSSRGEFHEKNSSAATWALRNGVMGDLFPKITRDWDYESANAEAQKYDKREDFRKFGGGASQWAIRNGVWDEICSHMTHQNRPVTLDEAKTEAKKYQTRAAFYRNSHRAYAWALRNGCMDDICQHMEPGLAASDADAIYVWSPEDMMGVFKFGVSSSRLADQRIKVVARAGRLGVGFCTIRHCRDARRLERRLLKIGQPYVWPQQFDGCTEFRQLGPKEINKAFLLLQPYEEVA